MNFKIGDKVRCINKADYTYYITPGSIYEVKDIRNENILIRTSYYGDYWYEADHFENTTDPIVDAVKLLEKNGYNVSEPTTYTLFFGGRYFSMYLDDNNTTMNLDSRWIKKKDVVTYVEHLQKLLEQMV